ncbi:ribonuclease H-like domain-containing protein [Tanacetum coccineum]
MVPRAVLMKFGLVSVNTSRQVNDAHSKTIVNATRPMSYLSKTAHSTVKRLIYKNTTFKNNNINQRVNIISGKNVNTARPKAVVNAVKGNNVNAVKASACWVWKPKTKVLDHGNPQMNLQDKGVIDSGCSRHMTGNTSYLTDYDEIDGGYVAFGGNSKGRKITRKGTIKSGNLYFNNVYFVRELKFNLFSVSQMCDKKNSVLFNDTDCIVLSPNFKLIDESQVLLRVPRKNNMYSVDLKNIVPKGGLTCLLAKATSDKSKLWHRRLGHLNFKTMNKLVKENLVRGLPSKLFENDQTCVACQKGKHHRASSDSRVPTTFWLGQKAVNTAAMFKIECKCPVTILNTKDHLGKFDGMADKGFFVGYSLNSKALRVFNCRTRNSENLHATNIRAHDQKSRVYFQDDRSKPSTDDGKKVNEVSRKDCEGIDQEKEDNINSTNNVNAASINEVNVVGRKTSIELPLDPNMSKLEDYSIMKKSDLLLSVVYFFFYKFCCELKPS